VRIHISPKQQEDRAGAEPLIVGKSDALEMIMKITFNAPEGGADTQLGVNLQEDLTVEISRLRSDDRSADALRTNAGDG